MIELKRCPFCGGEAKLLEHTFSHGDPCFGVECTQCGAWSYQWNTDEARAAAAWNRRVADEMEDDLK